MDGQNLSGRETLVVLEKNIIEYWNKIDATNKIIEQTKLNPKKIFLDGPPFATGTMHYGHILVSTLKDTMTRFLTMRGFSVDRRNGWDCHGVPIEMLAKKDIGYTTKTELIEYGIENHNNVCRNLIMQCADQWYKDFERIGRWVDTSREYKTSDINFMESTLWVFKRLYDSGLIFEGYKVMPYSTGCCTPLSHFEAKQNYKAVTDQSVTCCFEISSTDHCNFKPKGDYPVFILAWTTTPWTLPSNMALCTFRSGKLVHLFDNQLQRYVILSNSRYDSTYAKLKHENMPRFRLVEIIDSTDIINAEYKPLFDYVKCDNSCLAIEQRAYRVVSDAYVKDGGDDSGTGFVHISPSHGEDDFRVCCENGIIDSRNSRGNLVDLIDDDGCFLPVVGDFSGLYVKKAEPLIIRNLKSRGLLFDSKPYNHQYPHCYRTDTPLLYRVVSAWFLNAANEDFRQKMLANNKKINWMPASVGSNHFDSWLQNSVDWCISRSRYWGTPIPIWRSDDGCEIICVGSVAELEVLSGITGIKDLHIETVDSIKIPSREGRGMLSRVAGVLDCWFESGSMPYGQLHYPFENKNLIDENKHCIADFITESKDQTRGWFYTLTVLATALFDKPAFENVIVTGIINGTDGQKMAKRKANYPNPNILIDKYGADTLRLYLLSTPVVKAESVKFDESILAKLQQNSVVKIYLMVQFLVEKIRLYNLQNSDTPFMFPSRVEIDSIDNILDRWIINKTRLLLGDIARDMDNYKIVFVASKICNHIEQLTNWYIQMARERLKGSSGNNVDWRKALQTLLLVMVSFVKISAPVLPFISETVYQLLGPHIPNKLESVHFESYPSEDNLIHDNDLEHKFDIIQKVITLIRDARDSLKLPVKRPIDSIEIGCFNEKDWCIIQDILDYVKVQSNVLAISNLNTSDIVVVKAEANLGNLSTYLKELNLIKNMKQIMAFINSMTDVQLSEFRGNGFIMEPTYGIRLDEKLINSKYCLTDSSPNIKLCDSIVIRINTDYTSAVRYEHMMRLINKEIQMHRKESLLKPWQTINIFLCATSEVKDFIAEHREKFCCKNLNQITTCEQAHLLPNVTKHNITGSELLISSELVC